MVEACTGAALDALSAFTDAAGVDHAEDDEVGGHDQPNDPGAALDDVVAELLLAQPGMLDDPMPPLGLLLTAAGLEVSHGAVMLAGAPDDPDEVADLSSEEIRWFTLARGFLWTQEADRVSAEELDRFLTVLTLSPLVLERVADEVERNPADYAATRGDAASADAHLRRAGAAPEDGLRWALRPLLVSPPRTTPRNSQCPCGSGRKYKQCCLRTPSYPLSTRASARYASVATYATRAASNEIAREYAELVEPEAAMFALDLAIFKDGVLDGERVIRGSVHRQQCQLTITANSVERLGELQQQVLAAAPGSQLVSESIVPMEELLAEGERDPRPRVTGTPRPSSWASRRMRRPLLEQVMCEYEQRWLDQKLPALGGRTPRQSAAEGGSALAELHALLDDIQWRADNSGGGMSAARIRHHLGLTDA